MVSLHIYKTKARALQLSNSKDGEVNEEFRGEEGEGGG
jgi:hypothetical protein